MLHSLIYADSCLILRDKGKDLVCVSFENC